MHYSSDDAANMLTAMTGGNDAPELSLESLPTGTDSILDTEETALVGNVDIPSTVVCLVKETKIVDGFECRVYESLAEATARIESANMLELELNAA